jgi:hypothetical protein
MGALSPEKVCELLKTAEIPGNDQELEILRIRMGELLELNGEEWIREHRRMLLRQWRHVVETGTIRGKQE